MDGRRNRSTKSVASTPPVRGLGIDRPRHDYLKLQRFCDLPPHRDLTAPNQTARVHHPRLARHGRLDRGFRHRRRGHRQLPDAACRSGVRAARVGPGGSAALARVAPFRQPASTIKRAPTFGRPERVYRSPPRREPRGAGPGLRQRSAPKREGPTRGRPLLGLSGCSDASGDLSAAARIAAIGRAQAPPNPLSGGPRRTTFGSLFLCQNGASVAVWLPLIA